MWWNNMKVKILIISGVILAALIIILIACFAGGKNCVNPQ
jgi:vesicle-associated membrane protein 7